jgi:hypothetical protein
MLSRNWIPSLIRNLTPKFKRIASTLLRFSGEWKRPKVER